MSRINRTKESLATRVIGYRSRFFFSKELYTAEHRACRIPTTGFLLWSIDPLYAIDPVNISHILIINSKIYILNVHLYFFTMVHLFLRLQKSAYEQAISNADVKLHIED